ncbi:MAG TPA: hypothetical protein VIV61_02505 [Candidatus Ozemobacteraceae bacterium]
MVRLDRLNRECSGRPVSHAAPAQVACRVLGNEAFPCRLDPVCRPAGAHGVWFFYTAIAGSAAAAFVVLWWMLRLTRLSRLLDLVTGLIWPPLKWAAASLWRLKTAWDEVFP